MKNSNYLDENIPSIESLISSSKENLLKIEGLRKYNFNELFSWNSRGYYEKNVEEFKYIGYNSKLNEKKDFSHNEIKGLYIFYENNDAVYTGISRKLIRRLRNHFLGKTHFEASLVYLMARDEYDKAKGEYDGERTNFPLDEYLDNLQTKMKENWKISIYPMEDNYELYFLELIAACYFKTKWNSFGTH